MDHEWIHQVMSHCFKPPRRFLQPQSAAFCFFLFFFIFLWKTLSEIHCPEKLTFTVLWYLHITVIFAFSMERRFPSVFPKKNKKLKIPQKKKKNLARIHRYENRRKHVRFWSSVFMSQRWPVRPALGASTPKIHLWLRSQSNSAHVAHSGMPFTEQAGLYGITIEPPSKIETLLGKIHVYLKTPEGDTFPEKARLWERMRIQSFEYSFKLPYIP